ncbi:2'-5' RNA ligase [Isoptericola jiangsuensis]|uniref:2'-5' RNA ligase n=1 Tax=Isoptericola jiangsuensis TaxID=548579 RepID=A0A2A9EW86_9MICO|nr:2'-5' RNA ligase family protein [Isoptericola jiangsuensis]PFG42505.1 2'-5' RNA ligase [Isoptericola jiangsuensis]
MNLPPRGPEQVRIGVAVAIPEPYAGQLQEARARVGDPLADAIPPHITVIGPTVVDQSVLPAVAEHLEKVAAETAPFRVHLRGTGTFRPISPVVFVALAQGIGECELVEQQARSGVLAQDLRFNYHPHVTVAHEVDEEALDHAFEAMSDFDAEFDVTELWQYEHGDDGVWRPHRSFPLQGSTPPGA